MEALQKIRIRKGDTVVVIAGRDRGRTSNDQITLFKSNGVALEDISTAFRVYNLAKERKVGRNFDLWN